MFLPWPLALVQRRTKAEALVFTLAELSSMIPTAGGGYGFARRAFGPVGGFLTGTAMLLEYAIAPAAIAVFIGAYTQSLLGVGGWPIYLAFYAVFVGIHIYGAGTALKLMFLITAVAATALVVYVVAMIPHVSAANLFDRTPGGVLTSGIALVLAITAFAAGFLVDLRVVLYAAGFYAVMVAYFFFYSRHHLVAQAPEEEFEAIARAEAELGGG
jgi:amino acid transporter